MIAGATLRITCEGVEKGWRMGQDLVITVQINLLFLHSCFIFCFPEH